MWTVFFNGVANNASRVLEAISFLNLNVPVLLLAIGGFICALALSIAHAVTVDAVKDRVNKFLARFFNREMSDFESRLLLIRSTELTIYETLAIAEAKITVLMEEVDRLTANAADARASQARSEALAADNAKLRDRLTASEARNRALTNELVRLSEVYSADNASASSPL